MLNRCAIQLAADFRQKGFAIGTFNAVELDLDQLVGIECAIDFLQDGRRQPVLANAGHRVKGMGGGAQGATLGGGQFNHGRIVAF